MQRLSRSPPPRIKKSGVRRIKINSTYLYFGKDLKGNLIIKSDNIFTSPEGIKVQKEFVESLIDQKDKIPADTKFNCAELEGIWPVLYSMTSWNGKETALRLEEEAMAVHLGLRYVDPDKKYVQPGPSPRAETILE